MVHFEITSSDSINDVQAKVEVLKDAILQKLAGIEITLPQYATGIHLDVKLIETTTIGSPGKDFRISGVDFTFDILFGRT